MPPWPHGQRNGCSMNWPSVGCCAVDITSNVMELVVARHTAQTHVTVEAVGVNHVDRRTQSSPGPTRRNVLSPRERCLAGFVLSPSMELARGICGAADATPARLRRQPTSASGEQRDAFPVMMPP